MTKIFIAIVVSSMLASGCTTTAFMPIANCKPLSAYNTVILMPFSTDRVVVLEKRVRMIASPDTLSVISDTISEKLKDRLDNSGKFDKVIINGNCVDHAIKIEAKVTALTHHKGRYHIFAEGKISDCKTGVPLYKFELDERDSNLLVIPNQIANEVFNGIQKRMVCT